MPSSLAKSCVFCAVAGKKLCELLRRAADRIVRGLQHALADLLIGERLGVFGVQPGDDVLRRPGRNEHAEPLIEHHALEPDLLERGDVRQRGRARLRRLGQEAQRLVLEMRHQRRRAEARDRHMCRDEIVHRLAGTLVGHVRHLEPGLLDEPFAKEVLVRANARRGIALPRRLLHRRDEFSHRADAELLMHRPDQRLARDEDHRHQIFQIVAVHPQDLRRARNIVVGEEHGVAVGRALRHRLDADGPAGAGAIFDHHLLPEAARHVFAGQPRQEIRSAAGRQHHDYSHLSVWIGLRPGDPGNCRRCYGGTGQ